MSGAQYAEKILHIGKTDMYGINKTAWLAGETITSLTVTSDDLVTVNSSSFNGGDMMATITGVSAGMSKIHFDYTTTNRSDCQTILVRVKVCA